MVPTQHTDQAPVPPPAYHRTLAGALHLDAVTLVTGLYLLAQCDLAVQLAQRRCPPPLPAGPGGVPCLYREESLLLIALLRTLWCLSYREMHGLAGGMACTGMRVWASTRTEVDPLWRTPVDLGLKAPGSCSHAEAYGSVSTRVPD